MPAGSRNTLGVCNLCEAICGLELTIEGTGPEARVTSIRGNPADPLSRGYLCPKGVSLADVHADPDRLRAPVRRVGTGADAEWLEIGWDEALDRVADGLAGAINEHGRNAVGVYLGNPNAHSLGSATHGLAMVKMLRTRNRFSASSVDQIPHQLVAWQLYGHQLLLPIPDIDRTSYFLVFGANPMASNGSLMTVPDFPNRLRALRARGGRMVVVDPRRTETAKAADEHFFVRPGSDAVVVLAMVRTLFEEGLTRPAPYVDRVDRVRELVEPFTPEAAERVSGIAADDVRRLARELAAAAGRRRGVRPHRCLHDRVRIPGAVGHPVPQHPHRPLRPARRRAVHRAGDRLRRAAVRRHRPLRPVAQPRARHPGVRRRAAGRGHARGDRDARATARSTPC